MKKIKNVVLILALFLCFNGCEKNPAEVATSSNNDELTVDQAKAFVETQRMNEFTLKSGTSEKKRIKIRSDWNKSERSNNGNISVIETQIEAMGQFGFATPDCMEAWNTSKNDDYLYSMSRLVVIKYKKSGEMYSFIMSVVGDKHYLEGKRFKMSDNTYLKRDKDLSGLVLFHDLSGAFVNGWIYCDGQITNSIINPIDIDLTINLKSAMILLEIYDWVKECSYWGYYYVASDGTATSVSKRCTERFVVVGYYETGGGGSGSSSGSTGGGTDGGYNPPIQPCNCLDRCPTCGKCLGSTLKSAIMPGGGTTTTTPTTDPCESCTGHPVPEPEPVSIPAPDDPIESILIYLKCINSALPATITIYVDQPVPNSSQPASLSGTAGHAYIGISQGGNYSTFGFYPKTNAKISAKADYSALGDDSHRAYDVSVSKTVTSEQLQAVLSLTKNPPSIYNLDTYNCTDFAIAIGNLCGMNLLDTQSTWPGGGGSCPGALGQDIRNMILPTGMSKNTSGGTPPSNLQNCQ